MQFKKMVYFAIYFILLFGCDSKVKTDVKDKLIQEKKTQFRLITTQDEILNLKINEDNIEFKEYKNKVVLLNFFATWCPPCKAEIPHLNNLVQKFKGKFKVIAINLGGVNGATTPKDILDEFIKTNNIKYPIINDKSNVAFSKAVGTIRVIPTMFLYDTKGKKIQKFVGIVPEEMMEIDILNALDGQI